MGFWHTGYFEHHEEAGLDYSFVATAIRYQCPHCAASFDEPDELRKHRFSEHPYTQPVLYVRGSQIGATPFRIGEARAPTDFFADQFDVAVVNGREVTGDELGRLLATYQNDRVAIALINKGANAKFELLFRIASEPEMEGVDTAFRRLVKARHLDMRAIENFIVETKQFSTAVSYADGICQYLYGVLAKESAPDSNLTYEAYREKFNQAVDRLSEFDRPVANQIRALISFHFNHFSDSARLSSKGRLRLASQWFDGHLNGSAVGRFATTPITRNALEDMLTDFETSRILEWLLLSAKDMAASLGDAEALLRRELSSFDRVKVIMIVAEHCLDQGDFAKARRYARELSSNISTSRWAQAILEMSPMEQRT